MPDVFLSYQRAEREAVQIIANKLSELRVDVWFDTKLRAGGSFDEEIASALRGATAVLVCWTPGALASEWVRSEATFAKEEGRLVACFLEPTKLMPPFNVIHAEDLSAWAGQDDDLAWQKLLVRLAELLNRPGLPTYQAATSPSASPEDARAWISANGDDPLAPVLAARLGVFDQETPREKAERQKREKRARDERRKSQAILSRQLARERGIRDPKRERMRWIGLVGAVSAVGLITAAGFAYSLDAQARERTLRDHASTTAEVRAFLKKNGWHPVGAQARDKLTQLDAIAWREAERVGTIEAIHRYIDDAKNIPNGAYLAKAEAVAKHADQVAEVQTILKRLRYYNGPAHGGMDAATRDAIMRFKFRWQLPVTDVIDAPFMVQLNKALDYWIHPQLSEVMTSKSTEPFSDEDFLRAARGLGADAAALRAVIDVEVGPKGTGFDQRSQIRILFEPHWFGRLTQYKYNDSHPDISYVTRGARPYPNVPGNWVRLKEAFALDPDAALQSTSWGRFQVMGFQYKAAGFPTVGEFVRYMVESEGNQLEAFFLGFIRYKEIDDEIVRHDWAGFAQVYNGSAYKVNRYDEKLATAYEHYANQPSADIAQRDVEPEAAPEQR